MGMRTVSQACLASAEAQPPRLALLELRRAYLAAQQWREARDTQSPPTPDNSFHDGLANRGQ